MKLSDIPVTASTLPEINFWVAKQAQAYIFRDHGVATTIWKMGDEWVLQCDDYKWSGRKFMMVRLVPTHILWENLGLEPLD